MKVKKLVASLTAASCLSGVLSVMPQRSLQMISSAATKAGTMKLITLTLSQRSEAALILHEA